MSHILIILVILFSNLGNSFAMPALAKAATPKEETEELKDEFKRDTPRSMVNGFLNAVSEKDYTKAANYLDLSAVSKSKHYEGPEETAKQFHTLLDESGWIRSNTIISNKDTGELEDDLPPNLEKIGGIGTSKKIIPVMAEHIENEGQPGYWVISSETLVQIPSLIKDKRTSLINQYLPKPLIDNEFRGIPVGHWLALIALAFVSYALMWALMHSACFVIRKLTSRVTKNKTERHIIDAFIKPAQLYLSVWISLMAIRYIGVSVLARQAFSQLTYIAGWVALAWIMLRLIDVFADAARSRLIARGQFSVLSAIVFLRRSAKFGLYTIATISILDGLGFQVTTWLAALGIGGLAIALGAQKTVENFVGSLTLIADRPIGIGDFCKFGENTGTVEDIGMRSTKIRTPDRTVVTIPNGDFVSMKIENYSKKDSFFYNPVLNIHNLASEENLKKLVNDLRDFLQNHPKVNKSNARVFFAGFGQTSFNIEITAYMQTRNADEANFIKEELNIGVLQIVGKSGCTFAPSNSFYYKLLDKA